jgi:hypothetical protein
VAFPLPCRYWESNDQYLQGRDPEN